MIATIFTEGEPAVLNTLCRPPYVCRTHTMLCEYREGDDDARHLESLCCALLILVNEFGEFLFAVAKLNV